MINVQQVGKTPIDLLGTERGLYRRQISINSDEAKPIRKAIEVRS